ncbi:MAG TPA: DUF1513 domain-containing protein [Micropepsaceae bacterium]|nr:DUF1513 domain-containing protein [Micropepsaceae bacterium]
MGGAFAWKTRAAAAGNTPGVNLFSAARIGETDGAVRIDAEGLAGFSLPGRAHALTRLASGEVVLVGRRPGSFAAILDPENPQGRPRIFAPVAGHRFAGHAALHPDGRTLVTSEVDAETGVGKVVVRAAHDGAPRAIFAAGIEPHDLVFARGGSRLVVAIGGIAKAADVKGPPINAGNIDSALLELDPASGTVLKRHALGSDGKSLSLRHMALAPDGETIAFGMQDQERSQLRPLMGTLRVGGDLTLLPLPGEDPGMLRSYVGSVAIDSAGQFIAATSPKGGQIGLWSLGNGRWLGGFAVDDVCGLTADAQAGRFWATSGLGDVVKLRAGDAGFAAEAHWQAPAAFDNHLLRI